ncbi:TadE/TadG family type IV pilus assembly protein [Schaalia vaccimaxillae]|uniref:TadE/TadG family type IV pilus assembly protein n=1 Tax=Schaalia vaccimaxillae TaxID=183916 RepID=UPI0003B47BA5|nr:TadE/TadG family type IV pilus assembly protein [Schaalia vaccimaxillae]
MRSGDFKRSLGDDRGSEVVSTVLLQGLVMLIVLALLQMGFALHTRNMAISAAGEGARRGGLLGGNSQEAIARTDEIYSSVVGASSQRQISASYSTQAGREVIVVELTAALPILLNLGPQWLTVRGTSIVEGNDER